MTTATTSAEILHHTAAFCSETLANSDLRYRLVSTLAREIPSSNQLKLATESLENAISTTNPSVRLSALQLSENLLAAYPENPISSFLLSLIHTLCRRPVDAALSLFDAFIAYPSLARSEIAPVLFEELFLVHLLPVLRWFSDQRSRILSSSSPNLNYCSDDRSVSCESVSTRSLSKMSGDQASGLKELEGDYEEVLDENCRVFINYFKEVLRNKDENALISPPILIQPKKGIGEKSEYSTDEKIKMEGAVLKNGRYNPIWAEGEKSVEFYSCNGSDKLKSLRPYPERVPPNIFTDQNFSSSLKASPILTSTSEFESSSDDNPENSSSSESEVKTVEKNRKMALFESRQCQTQKQKWPISAESSSSPDRPMADFDNPPGGGKHAPPKDFVCPITSYIFDDPVTLETGQTYERRAIQEWLDRGNSSCPITRQKLQSAQLPRTNYVLKRLIASWVEQNPSSIPIYSESISLESEPMFNPTIPSTSPNSVISQAATDGAVSELRVAITNLCMSEILKESEMAVLRIEQFWQEESKEVEIQTMLSKPPIINGFVEVLFNSVDPQVLTATVFLLCELGSRDKAVIQTLTQVESDVEGVVALFKKGLLEAVVLIYLLRPSSTTLVEMDMVEALLVVIDKREEDFLKMCLKPKTASVLLLGQILRTCEESIISSISQTVASGKSIESIVSSLKAEWLEERIAAIGILLRCIQEYGKCRSIIADKAELASILESFTGASDGERFEIVQLLSELVKLNRRTLNEEVLHIIKDEGAFSTMHNLLIFQQTALQDQCPVVAGLLLQLDLLTEPRKMSIYREEAIDTLISCLKNTDFPAAQIAAAETILTLQGRFTSAGKPLTRALLLKRAGLGKNYKTIMRAEQLSNTSGELEENLEEDEKAADKWERKVAYILASHDFGLLFEALAEGLKSRYAELCSACFVSATWLIHMLTVLPDTGLQGAARACLLKHFISIFNSAKDIEDRALSMLALSSFTRDPEGLRDLTSNMKDILKGLRELRKSSTLAFEMMKVLSEKNDSSAQDLWTHKELVQVDCGKNGEVLCIVCFKDKIFSGHSDGTIKIWHRRGSILHLIQETHEHSKAITSLNILGDRLFSGSLDKTARVWSISNEIMHCIQVHDMKDQVHNLVVANSFSCFIPQGAGVKVHSWNGGSKLLNSNKYVKCLALANGKLYCGCHDNSIQEIDLATGTISTIQSGYRKLLGKSNPVQALEVHNGLMYSASYSLDGATVKVWNASNCSLKATLQLTSEVRAFAISSELIYLGCKAGIVEIWSKEKQTGVETLQTGAHGKVLCMALDGDEEVLVIGTSDGLIQAWGLS